MTIRASAALRSLPAGYQFGDAGRGAADTFTVRVPLTMAPSGRFEQAETTHEHGVWAYDPMTYDYICRCGARCDKASFYSDRPLWTADLQRAQARS